MGDDLYLQDFNKLPAEESFADVLLHLDDGEGGELADHVVELECHHAHVLELAVT